MKKLRDLRSTYKSEAVDTTDTGGAEEVSMATSQIKAMRHYLDGIEKRVKAEGDMEEWFQNKLTKANDYLKTLYGYGKGKTNESIEVEEAAQFKVDIEGLPPTFMQGKSSAEILAKLRKIVKQPSMIKDVERHTDMEVKKAYRQKAQGRDVDEEAKYDYGTPESVKSMKKTTPGQNEGTAQIRMNRALKKQGVGKNDDFYLSKMDPETRKKYEPKKVERKPVSVEPPKHKPFSWIKTKEDTEIDEISLNKIRSKMYKAAKFLGDVQSVKKGKVGKRVARRAAGKVTGKVLGKLFK